jgi:hypothetical protein
MSFTILLPSPDAESSWPGTIRRAVPDGVAEIYAEAKDGADQCQEDETTRPNSGPSSG